MWVFVVSKEHQKDDQLFVLPGLRPSQRPGALFGALDAQNSSAKQRIWVKNWETPKRGFKTSFQNHMGHLVDNMLGQNIKKTFFGVLVRRGDLE